VQGELQQKLDVFANETVRHSVQHTGRICIMGSEEDENPVQSQPASRPANTCCSTIRSMAQPTST